MMQPKPRIKPDPQCCQVMHLSLEGGERQVIKQCSCKPMVIVRELEVQEDGQTGAMSMCKSCYGAFLQSRTLISKYRVRWLY